LRVGVQRGAEATQRVPLVTYVISLRLKLRLPALCGRGQQRCCRCI
jgi:hypothetical protein